MSKKIFITGGGGYVGSRLVPILLKKKFIVTVFDTFYFGNKLKKNKNLKIVNGDIRDVKFLEKNCSGSDIFLHLACVSNDTSFELNKKLSKSINFDCFEPIVKAAKNSKIKRFIYASTCSVYGVSKKKNVKEDHPLVPLTLYNKYKGMCEPILFKHTNKQFDGVIFRPATVCGYSPRMRFDLSVNILTNYAYNRNYINVLGGDQLRPNLHILDYCDVVIKLINAPSKKIKNKIFNVGNENKSIFQIAQIVKKTISKKIKIKIKIFKKKSDDKRSYHINSDKIKRELRFRPRRKIQHAVVEIYKAFKKKQLPGSFKNLNYFNVKKMLKLKLK